ncbi:cytochrome P450 [Streptomyces niveus]|uniref:cytochrome P450 n=1 Tax=Streptomyces niveus TaxID=193462 RepID=UPI0035DEB068
MNIPTKSATRHRKGTVLASAHGIPPIVPGRLPLLGHGLSMAGSSNRLKFMRDVRAYGPIVRIRLGPKSVAVVNDPTLIHEMLTRQADAFSKGLLLEGLKLFNKDALPITEGRVHLTRRRQMHPPFHREMVRSYVEKMVRTSAPAIDSWDPSTTFDMKTEMQLITQNVVMSALFSSVPAREPARVILESVDTVFRAALLKVLLPIRALESLPTRGNRKIAAASSALRDGVTEIIEDHQTRPDSYQDLISLLMNTQDDGGRAMDGNDILSEVTALLAASSETTAVVLSWLFYELSRNPDLERRLHEEVDTALAGDELTADHLGRLPFTGRLVQETLRLYAPWFLTRQALRDVRLGKTVLPAGTDVIFSPYAVHRDPSLYPNPDRFDPDRWHPDRPQPPREAFLPFGAGKRMCIGDVFAETEAKVVTALIASRWRLKAAPMRGSVRAVGQMTTQPSRLRMIPELRTDAPDRSAQSV